MRLSGVVLAGVGGAVLLGLGGWFRAMELEQIVHVTTRLVFLLGIVLVLAVLDQIRYRMKKGRMPGPEWIPPFIGMLLRSLNPKFSDYIATWNLGPVSCSSILHKFIAFGTSTEMARKIFNTPSVLVPAGPTSLKMLLFDDNWIFLQGKSHVEYRRKLAPLFTRSALSTYLPFQQQMYNEYIERWLAEPQPQEFMNKLRELNMATALAVFLNRRYLQPHHYQQMTSDYTTLTYALQLVNFPIPLPGTQLAKAVKSRTRIMEVLISCAEQSIARLSKPGEEAESLLDKWVEALLKEQNEWKEEDGKEKPRMFTPREIAMTILTIIFAAQDASTSSLTWGMCLLEQHPHVLARIREEQQRLRPNNEEITYETLYQMTYTQAVAKEVLRYRPPVLLMPYEAKKECTLGEHTLAPGTIAIASVWPATHNPEAWTEPDKFDPDRFMPERQEDAKSAQHYLVWGHGPHMCIGRDYASGHLAAFLATLSTKCDWTRVKSEGMDDIVILATTFPQDGARFSLKRRA